MIIDATDLIVGRFVSTVAKRVMLGEKIDVINCEKAVISGSRGDIIARFKHKRRRTTPAKGPFIHRMPDRFMRRIIRGMLPYKKEKGRNAFENVMCYIGVPPQFEGKKFETVEEANVATRKTTKFITVADLCQEMGAKL